MRTEPSFPLDAGEIPADHLFFVMLAVMIGLVAGMAAGIVLMSDLLPALA